MITFLILTVAFLPYKKVVAPSHSVDYYVGQEVIMSGGAKKRVTAIDNSNAFYPIKVGGRGFNRAGQYVVGKRTKGFDIVKVVVGVESFPATASKSEEAKQ